MKTKQTQLDSSRSPTSTAQETFNEESTLQLSYKSQSENTIVRRSYVNHGSFVREVNREWMYNYVEKQWESVHRLVRDYELSDGGETLTGDGSNWRGTGRNWERWFIQRHYELLGCRFPSQEIPEPNEVADHDPVDLPPEIPESEHN